MSGNVSLYNETNGAAIPPTPTVGGVGLLADSHKRADFGSLKPGYALVLVGETQGWLGASMYLRVPVEVSYSAGVRATRRSET